MPVTFDAYCEVIVVTAKWSVLLKSVPKKRLFWFQNVHVAEWSFENYRAENGRTFSSGSSE